MKSYLYGLSNLFTNNKKEILIFFVILFVSFLAVFYSKTLPLTTRGDTYVTLLANKAVADPTFPDRSLILNFDFKPYLYTDILAFFDTHFELFTYKLILLFILVFLISYSAYVSLRILGFSSFISILVALVSLLPRVGVGGEAWGVFTTDDVLGRNFGLPFIWLVSALFLRRKFDNKTLWPVFVLSGLASYVHPVSMIFFNGLLFLVLFIWAVKDKKEDIRNIGYSILAFCLSSSILLYKIFFITRDMGTSRIGDVPASTKEYFEALVYRVNWDFFPQSAIYTVHFFIINFVFFVAIGYVIWNIYNNKIDKNSLLYFISKFSLLIILLSVFLSFFIPNFELWLVKNYNFPFIIQQSSRFFKYYYLGQYLLTAVAVKIFFDNFRNNKKIIFVIFLFVGLASSTFGFEIFKFFVGYKNYKQEYIPNYLQKNKLADDQVVFPKICKQMESVGIKKDDLVISDDFQLRYFCGIKLLTTFEEGSAYFVLGKNELVWWYRVYTEQKKVLYGNNPNDFLVFAKKFKADYALIEINSPLLAQFEKSGIVVSKGDRLAIIKL